MSKEITSLKYSEKIVEVAYHNFPLIYPKDTVIKCIDALIKEYSDQQNKELIEQLAESELLVKERTSLSIDYVNQINDLKKQLSEKDKESFRFQQLYEDYLEDWKQSLDKLDCDGSELDKIITYLQKNDYVFSNPIDITSITTVKDGKVYFKDVFKDVEQDFWVECNVCKSRLKNWAGSTSCCGSIAYVVKDMESESNEAMELKYTTQEIIDAVNYGFKYAIESQNNGLYVPIGNILQWIMHKRNLLNVPKEFEIFKHNKTK